VVAATYMYVNTAALLLLHVCEVSSCHVSTYQLLILMRYIVPYDCYKILYAVRCRTCALGGPFCTCNQAAKALDKLLYHAKTNSMCRERPVFARQMHAAQHQSVQVYKSRSLQFSMSHSVIIVVHTNNKECVHAPLHGLKANHGATPSDCRFADLNLLSTCRKFHTALPQYDYAAEACKQASAVDWHRSICANQQSERCVSSTATRTDQTLKHVIS